MNRQKITYNFSADKNRLLIEERGISFEEIISELDEGRILDTVNHPNQKKYPHQQMYVVYLEGYVYVIPFVVEAEGSIFLKTIFASSKAKKKYHHLIVGGNENES
jgi:uncharacterized DUF497 family protein